MSLRSVLVLALICLLRSLAMFDVTAMNVALPSMVTDLGASLEIAQWALAGYSLALAAGVLPAGAVVDRIGSRRVLLCGLGLLAFGALLGGLVHVPAFVIVARILMGAGAAVVLPATFAVLSAEFAPGVRGRAVAAVWAVSTVVLVAGPVIGGLLVEAFGWASVLLVNVPVCVLAAAACLLLPDRGTGRGRVDILGMVLSAVGAATIVLGTISLGRGGAAVVVAPPAIALGAASLVAFVAWERRRPEPLLDLGLLRRPRVVAAAIEGFLGQFALTGAIFVLTLYLQFVLGFTPLEAGLRALPVMAALLLLTQFGERMVRTFGDIQVLVLGLFVLAAGTAQLATLDAVDGYVDSIPGLLLVGAGMGLALPTSTVMLLNAVPANSAGTASGFAATVQEFGNAMGVAVLGGIVANAISSRSGAAGSGGAESLATVLGAGMDPAVRSAFFTGMTSAYVLATAVLVVGGLLCWTVVRWSPARPASR